MRQKLDIHSFQFYSNSEGLSSLTELEVLLPTDLSKGMFRWEVDGLWGSPSSSRITVHFINEEQYKNQLSTFYRILNGERNASVGEGIQVLQPLFLFGTTIRGQKWLGIGRCELSNTVGGSLAEILSDRGKIEKLYGGNSTDRLFLAYQTALAFKLVNHAGYFIKTLTINDVYIDLKQFLVKIPIENILFDSLNVGESSDKRTPSLFPYESLYEGAFNSDTNKWLLFIIIHYLVFGFHPLSFMKDFSAEGFRELAFKPFIYSELAECFRPQKNVDNSYQLNRFKEVLNEIEGLPLFEYLKDSFEKGILTVENRIPIFTWAFSLKAFEKKPEILAVLNENPSADNEYKAHLSWSIKYASQILVDGKRVLQESQYVFQVTESKRIQILAFNGFGETKKTVFVEVKGTKPIIKEFSISPSVIKEGDNLDLSLSWDVQNAKEVFITSLGALPSKGKRPIKSPTESTEYKLTAKSIDGHEIAKVITLSVRDSNSIIKVNPKDYNDTSVSGVGDSRKLNPTPNHPDECEKTSIKDNTSGNDTKDTTEDQSDGEFAEVDGQNGIDEGEATKIDERKESTDQYELEKLYGSSGENLVRTPQEDTTDQNTEDSSKAETNISPNYTDHSENVYQPVENETSLEEDDKDEETSKEGDLRNENNSTNLNEKLKRLVPFVVLLGIFVIGGIVLFKPSKKNNRLERLSENLECINSKLRETNFRDLDAFQVRIESIDLYIYGLKDKPSKTQVKYLEGIMGELENDLKLSGVDLSNCDL